MESACTAFAIPVPFKSQSEATFSSGSRRLCVGHSRVVHRGRAGLHRRTTLISSAEKQGDSASDGSFDEAFNEGKEIRDMLQTLNDDREKEAAETSARLNEMSEQLASMIASIREKAGMPPVADPPSAAATQAKPQTAPPKSAQSGEESTSSDEPYMDPSNFGIDSAAGWQVLASENQLPQVDETGLKFRIECDAEGCSIIELDENTPAGPGVRSQFMQSGPGFRVGYDPEGPRSFCATVGNENWLLALSKDEIRHFKRLCLALQKKMDRIGRGLEEAPDQKRTVRRSSDGMFNERVGRTGSDCSVELESKLLWVQAFGQPVAGQYSIRAIFMEGRQSEGYWPREAVPGMLGGVAMLKIE